MQNSFAISVQT